MISDALCRVTVQRDGDAVDLALPRHVPISRLVPAIVDIVGGDDATTVCHWRLARIGQSALDGSLSLGDNGIDDGAILLLDIDDPPPPQWTVLDPSSTIAAVHHVGYRAGAAALACGMVLLFPGVVALVRSASSVASVIGALLVAVSTAAAIVTRRDKCRCSALSVVALVLAGVVGARAVPAAAVSAHVLLASAGTFAVAVVLMRLSGCATVLLAAVLTASMLIGVVCAVVVICGWDADTGAAALAALSVAVVATAPRIALAVAGISPDRGDALSATLALRTLTGVVAGTAAAATLGAGVATAAELADGSHWTAVGFPMLLGAVAVLRSRSYADAACRAALSVSGAACVAIGFTAALLAVPAHAPWIGLVPAAVGLAVMRPADGTVMSPVVGRATDVLHHVALAAVFPAACWVGDLFDFIRNVTLI
jgi:type VII secretion integral membrane protein EccD